MTLNYHIITPKHSILQRGAIIALLNLLILASTVTIALQYSTDKVPVFVPIFFVVALIPAYIISKTSLKYVIIGTLKINESQVQIESNKLIKSINFKDIEKIEYCGNIVDSPIIKRSPNHKSFLIKIQDIENHNILIEVDRKSFLLKDDDASTKWQSIEKTLDSINSTMKIIYNRKLRGA